MDRHDSYKIILVCIIAQFMLCFNLSLTQYKAKYISLSDALINISLHKRMPL